MSTSEENKGKREKEREEREEKNGRGIVPSGNDDFGLDRNSFDDGLDEREKLLQRFLDDTSIEQGQSTMDHYKPRNDMANLDIADYPEVHTGDEMAIKIDHLQKIVCEIEKRDDHLRPLNEFNSDIYKVNYPNSLNHEQLLAATTIKGPLLVIAGAGSGKTRIIVYRVSYLLENHVDPQRVLLLTFTRKAAHEMINRVGELLHDNRVSKVNGGTFHSFAALTLRKYANFLQLNPKFNIIDSADSEDVIDLLRSEMKYDRADKRFPKKHRIYEIFSYSRNQNSSIRQVVEKDYSGLIDYIPDMELIYKGYTAYKKRSNLIDFDDLIEIFRDKLLDNPVFRNQLQKKFDYIMVDEYQDTNVIQKEIVDLLGEKHRNVMVVGDDAQSIYAFRGANYENILRFPETYPDCKVIKIEKNYRSNQRILDFTNQIIEKAQIGYRKHLVSQHVNDNIPCINRFYDQEEEAAFIVDRIVELIEKDISLNEIAVLNRADWHNRFIQVELNKRGIPYVVVGGFRFNERMHVKDIIAYLRIVFNPSDAVAWHRILKLVPGIGKVTAGNIITEIRKSGKNFDFVMFSRRSYYEELLKLGEMFRKVAEPKVSLKEKIEIIKDYYSPILRQRETDYETRLLDIDVLIKLSGKYKSIERFLSDFALDPPARYATGESTPLIDESEEEGKVTLSTVHSAKGLEWYAVFIPHALDGLFPSNRAKDIEEMEEERRLFYVACSRAKEQLFITFPSYVNSYNAFFNLPSRFLVEMDKEKYVLMEG